MALFSSPLWHALCVRRRFWRTALNAYPNFHVRRGVAASLSLAALIALAGCNGKGGPPAFPPPDVNVIKVATEPVTIFEEYVGQTEAVDTVEIRARVSGLLEKQAFEDGGRVAAGSVLFIIDPQPYKAALDQAKAALALAQAQHLNSKQQLERVRPLAKERALSQQDLDTAVAKEAIDAATEEAARAQVRTAELNLDYTTIRAPRDGVISKALIKAGGLVNASTTLLTTLYSVNPIYVNFTVSELKLLELQRDLNRNPNDTKGKLPAFKLRLADGSEYKLPGKINFVDTAVDSKTGTLQVRVQVPNPDSLLRAGQLVRVIMPSLTQKEAFRIPQQAVQEMQGKRSVLVVDGENKAQFREVVANSRSGNDWIVESGLQPGEMVIVEGTGKSRPGAPVKPTVIEPSQIGKMDGKGDGKGPAKGDTKAEAKAAEPAKADAAKADAAKAAK
ncbi:MAG: efflux RND transporter periplasmic adaptor subunit [Betaproteobacteria bacterium]|nr:efflux RND transporter periplasmic adaptor subunit [Betaproteobacteria bacterium]